MVSNFADSFSAAMSGAGSSVSAIDTSGLSASNVAAIDVPVTVDTSEADAALQQLDAQSATTTADLGAIADSGATPALDQIGAGADQAGQGLTTAGDAATNMAASATSASGGVDALGGSVSALQGTSALATGDIGAFGNVVGDLGPSAGAAVAGVVALAGGLGVMVSSAIGTESALQRADSILGTFKSSVENIKVGDLNISLNDLAGKMGETQTSMLNAATNAFQFADSAGVGGAAASRFSNEVLALASRAVAATPALGSVADVANTLELRLASGGTRLARYGIDLSTASINTLALAESGKTTASSLTAGEKAVAAADLATQKYGSTLKESVDNASKNAEIQVRQLKSSFEDFIGTMAKPLVAPVLEIFKELIPIGEDAARILMSIGSAALPLLAAAAGLVGPPLKLIADVLGAIPAPVLTATIAILALGKAFSTLIEAGGISSVFDAVAVGRFGSAIAEVGSTLTTAAGGFSVVGAAALALPVALTLGVVAFTAFEASASGTEVAFNNLADAIKSKSVPAIEQQVGALQSASAAQLATDLAAVRGTDVASQHAQAAVKSASASRLAADMQDAWAAAMKDGIPSMQAFITALGNNGPNVEKYKTQLALVTAESRASAQASAAVAAANDPLATSFKDAATAAGTLVASMFEVDNAMASTIDKDVAAQKAFEAFGTALSKGNATDIEAAAGKLALAASDKTYQDTLLATGDAQKAATDATKTYSSTLQSLINSIPVDNPAHAALQAILDEGTAATAPKVIPISVNTGDSITKMAGIQKALDDLKQGKPPDVIINDLATKGSANANLAINAIRQGVPPNVVIDDLASGNIADINARVAAMPDKTITVTLNEVLGTMAAIGLGPTPVPKNMAGGPVGAGELTLVGEGGVELFRPDTAGTIIPNDQLTAPGGNAALTDAAVHLDKAAAALQSGAGQFQIIMVSPQQAVAMVPTAAQPAVAAFLRGR